VIQNGSSSWILSRPRRRPILAMLQGQQESTVFPTPSLRDPYHGAAVNFGSAFHRGF
jgi:hypothetical protein